MRYIALIVLALVLAGCGSASPTESHPAATHSAATHSAATEMSAWEAGTGGKDLRAVAKDLAQVSTDAGADNATALRSDGYQLFKEVAPATNHLPPVDGGAYLKIISELAVAGLSLSACCDGTAQGNQQLTYADKALKGASAMLKGVTAPWASQF